LCRISRSCRIRRSEDEGHHLFSRQCRPVFQQYRRVSGLNVHACSVTECVVLSGTQLLHVSRHDLCSVAGHSAYVLVSSVDGWTPSQRDSCGVNASIWLVYSRMSFVWLRRFVMQRACVRVSDLSVPFRKTSCYSLQSERQKQSVSTRLESFSKACTAISSSGI
jgi:hypothetical protein